MISTVEVFVPGTPVSKGSARAYMVKGKPLVVQDNAARQKPWASSISWMSLIAMKGQKMTTGPVELILRFYMPRPKTHYGTGRNAGNLKSSADHKQHIIKPDLDKLIRCVKDALTGVVWKDDSQCYKVTAEKRYENSSSGPGVLITARELPTGENT